MTKPSATIQVDVEALARALVPLLIPPLVDALAGGNSVSARGRRIQPPPAPPPRRFWTEKEAADWKGTPDRRIVWDEQGMVLSMDNLHDRLSPGQRVTSSAGTRPAHGPGFS